MTETFIVVTAMESPIFRTAVKCDSDFLSYHKKVTATTVMRSVVVNKY